jgi:RND family efflux transporter MFP subunit
VLAIVVGMSPILALLACTEDPPAPPPVVRPIKIVEIGEKAEGIREYPGRIRAAQQVDMAFEVQGRVIEFVHPEGTFVEEGAVLARLDPRDYQNELQQSIARRNRAKTYLDRIALAHETRAVSDQDLTNAQAQLEVAAAEVKIRRKALDDTVLRAPFAGVMARKLVEDFANVQAKEPVLVFEDPSYLEIKVAVPERDMAARQALEETREEITARIEPQVEITSIPGRRFPGRLKEIATHADPSTRTYEATVVFDRPADVNVLPGMTAKVRVHLTAGEEEVVIPAQATVADDDGRASVWLVDPATMTVRRQAVTLGELAGDRVFVKEGLSSGDLVAVSGVAQLREGMAVRRWER